MSTERSNQPSRPPLKPSLSSNRTARTPTTPRLAAVNATTLPKSASPHPTPTVRSGPPTSTIKQAATPVNDALANGNVTPRSSARASRSGSANGSPTTVTRPKSAAVRSSDKSGSPGPENRAQASRPKSLVGDNVRSLSPLIRAPASSERGSDYADGEIGNKFFHASEASKQDAIPKATRAPEKGSVLPRRWQARGEQSISREIACIVCRLRAATYQVMAQIRARVANTRESSHSIAGAKRALQYLTFLSRKLCAVQ